MASSTKGAAVFRSAAALAALLCSGCTSINLHANTLVGTDWRVVAVNGQQTPQGDYSMRFGAGGAFGAKFGCNLMGGEYRLAGSTLVVSNLNQTLMGCPEPAATLESRGGAILGQPMQVSFSSSDRMALSNQAGSIALDRAL